MIANREIPKIRKSYVCMGNIMFQTIFNISVHTFWRATAKYTISEPASRMSHILDDYLRYDFENPALER